MWDGGSSTRSGGGRRVRSLLRKFVFFGFRGREPGTSREFCQDVPDPGGVQKVCATKVVLVFVPYKKGGVVKGGVWKRKPPQTNAHERRQMQISGTLKGPPRTNKRKIKELHPLLCTPFGFRSSPIKQRDIAIYRSECPSLAIVV